MLKSISAGVITAFSALTFLTPSVSAVPAWSGMMYVAQPDGSTLSVRKVGDERGHFLMTADGHLIKEKGGGYYYVLPSGELSSMQANDPERRAPREKALLASFDSRESVENARKLISATNTKFSKGLRAQGDFKPEIPDNPVPGLFDNSFPANGKRKSLVFLVEYSDVSFSIPDAHDYFDRMLNEKGFSDNGCTMSARDYFIEASNGAFEPEFVVYGPLKLKNPRRYYGMNDESGRDRAPEEMVIEACDAYDSEIDFKEFDTNNDGKIDNIFVFYAGVGENASTITSSVWPHSYDVLATRRLLYDGVLLSTYGCSNELVPHLDSGNRSELYLDAIGTFCHEFGHVIGLPDLYTTGYVQGVHDPGKWSIMANGSYNNNGCTPPTYSSFERAALGWTEPELIRTGKYELEHLLVSNKAYMIPTENKNEFFLLENRLQMGSDEYIPGEGMLVWHIDYDQDVWEMNTCNNDPDHQRIDIVEAHGLEALLRIYEAFPALESTTFDFDSKPSLRSWSGNNLGLGLYNINLSDDGLITFDAKVDYEPLPVISPEVEMVGIFVSDGVITNVGKTGEKAYVYDISGRLVGEIPCGTSSSLLGKGVYVVRVGDKVVKILNH